MRHVLTERQLQILALIAKRIRIDGWPPTIRELADALSIRSTNGAADHLRRLEEKGYLLRGPAQARAMKLTPLGRKALGVP